jgi:hypothetical protein
LNLAHQPLHLRLGTLAFCDIPHHGQHQLPLLNLHRAQHDVDRKLRAIGALREELQAGTHGTCLRITHVMGAMRDMPVTKTFRDQHFDGLAEHVFTREPKHGFRRFVNAVDLAIFVHHDGRVGRLLVELLERRPGLV